jgi:hypothetical protein
MGSPIESIILYHGAVAVPTILSRQRDNWSKLNVLT